MPTYNAYDNYAEPTYGYADMRSSGEPTNYKRVYGFGDTMRYDTPRIENEMQSMHGSMERGHGSSSGMEKLTPQIANEWVRTMQNEDGTSGEHWTMEQTNQLMQQKGYKLDPVEFYAAMNMMYSDYYRVAKKMNVNNADFYAAMAEAFLNDTDAGEGKLAAYYECCSK